MKYLRLFEEFISEVVNITDLKKKDPHALSSRKLFKHMLSGKKRVMFLVDSGIRYINSDEDMEVLQMARDAGFGVIEMDQDPAPGKAYVVYNKKPGAKRMAERLAEIAKKHDGYLADKTAEEAREIGELLDYNKEDIDWYVNKNYGK